MRRGRWSCLLLAAASALQLGACASTAPIQAQDASLPGKDACFWTRDVYDWTVLDSSTLIVNAPGPHNYYLVKLFAPIPDLSFRMRLGFESKGGTMDRFCRDNGYVITRDSFQRREPVVAVHALSPPEAKQLLGGAPGAQTQRSGSGNANPPSQ